MTYKKISELIPYANNSRTHSNDQITQLAAAIKHFGFCGSIVVRGESAVRV